MPVAEARRPDVLAPQAPALLVPGRNCWRIEHARSLRHARRRRAVLRRRARGAAHGAALDLHPRLGHRQPHAPRSGGRRRRLARAAGRVPGRAGEGPAAPARLRADVGLRDALRRRARVDADLQARPADAPAALVPPRRAPSRRRLAPPEDRRRRRQRRLRQRLRPHALALGHLRARLRGPAPPQPVQPRVRTVPRRGRGRRRRLRARAGRARARTLDARHRAAPARVGATARPGSLAGRHTAGFRRRGRRHRAHRAALRELRGHRGDPPAAPRRDRVCAAAPLRREPVLHVAHHRRRARPAPRRARRAGDRDRVAPNAERLARGLDDGRAARSHRPRAARGRPGAPLPAAVPSARLAGPRQGLPQRPQQGPHRGRRVRDHRLGEPVQSLDGPRHRVQPRDRGARRPAPRRRRSRGCAPGCSPSTSAPPRRT